jgi:DNA-binding CsgD family transcriptional regulator
MPYNKDKPDFWDKTPETYAETPEYPDGVYLKADGKPDPRKGKLSNRQRTFAELIVEGVYSNAECARRAGFSEVTASDYATKLLNGVDFPHVVELITELREERQRKYGVTLIGQLTRLAKLSEGAEKSNQYSAAINAEKLRSAMGGRRIPRLHDCSRWSALLGRVEGIQKCEVAFIWHFEVRKPLILHRNPCPRCEDRGSRALVGCGMLCGLRRWIILQSLQSRGELCGSAALFSC